MKRTFLIIIIGVLCTGFVSAVWWDPFGLFASSSDEPLLESYIDNDDIYINITPTQMYSSGYSTIELMTKQFTGDANVVFGFNSTSTKPKAIYIYNPHNISVTKRYFCGAEDMSFITENDNYFECYVNGEMIFNHSAYDYNNGYFYWNETKEVEYKEINKIFDKIEYNFSGKDTWYYTTNIPIVAGELYKLKIYLEIPINTVGKYDFGIFPSSYGGNIGEAINNNHLFFVDPYWNTTEEYVDVLIMTSDTRPNKNNKTDWRYKDIIEQQQGNSKQGYIIGVKPFNSSWGNLELQPSRAIIVTTPKYLFNENWTLPIYDENGTIIFERKYKVNIENLLTTEEYNALLNISYNEIVNWSIRKDNIDLNNYIELVDFNENRDDLYLHGSSGNFTICPSGCDYTTVRLFESNENSDLTGTGPARATITENFTELILVNFVGWTTTADDFIEIKTNGTARHNGVFNTSFYHYSLDVFNPALLISEDYAIIDGLQFKNPNANGVGIGVTSQTNLNANIIIKNNIFYDIGLLCISMGSIDYNWTISNNVMAKCGTGVNNFNFVNNVNAQEWKLYENTIVNSSIGVRTFTQLVLDARNNLVYGNADDWEGRQRATSTNNTISDGVGIDGAYFNFTGISDSVIFEDFDNNDFRLVSGSPAIDNGSTIGAPFDVDIINTSRPQGDAWDIGAFEFIQDGVTTFIVNLMNPANNTIENVTSTPDFQFNVTGTESSYDCTLFLNDTSKGVNTSVLNNTATNITSSSLINSIYDWNVNCTANSITNSSEIRVITVNVSAVDSCTYTSGNWEIDCSDNCVISSPVDVGGNNISIIGTGTFFTSVNIVNYLKLYIQGTDGNNICRVTCGSGGCFKS